MMIRIAITTQLNDMNTKKHIAVTADRSIEFNSVYTCDNVLPYYASDLREFL
jgi:hypothetical protein